MLTFRIDSSFYGNARQVVINQQQGTDHGF